MTDSVTFYKRIDKNKWNLKEIIKMVDIIKTHIKPIMAGAILIALLAIILALLTTNGTVANAFSSMLSTIFSKGLDAGGF